MSPEFIEKWENLLEGVDKEKIPIEFVKKIVLRLRQRRQHTINVERLMEQGLYPEEIEEEITAKLIDLDESVIGIEFVLNVESIAEVVQPETDNFLKRI